MMRLYMTLGVILMGLGLVHGQMPADSLFARATDAYNEGDYDKAVTLYGQILETGNHSAALYFNLGNAHYKQGHIAPSIYNYEKALLLDPADSEISNNLEFARNMTLDAIQPLPQSDIRKAYGTVLNHFTMDQWAYLGIAFMILFVIGALLYYLFYLPNQKRIALIGALIALFLSIGTTLMAFLNYRAYRQDQPAIVFAEALNIRSEPNARAEAVFELHEGTKVQVLDSLDGWIHLRIADGQTGWASGKHLKLLKDF